MTTEKELTKNEFDQTHTWFLSARDDDKNVSVCTCRKCGLLRVQTLSGCFYFTQMSGPFIRCRWQPGKEDDAAPVAQEEEVK